nr:type VI secretion system tip protein VgrG [Pseudomonas sp. BSw22131]
MNRFEAQPYGVPYRSAPEHHKPHMPGPQTAVVVTPPDHEVFTDALNRVCVRFHWDRRTPEGQLGSCWIRMLQNSSGPDWGSVQVPRGGEEVVVTFLDNDIDRPLILGQVYGGDKPAWHSSGQMSGYKSKELKGRGFNQWVMDDTPQQVRTQLHSSHAHTQLNMGYLIDQQGNQRGGLRGSGFELRSDAFGAIRAQQGLHVSTWKRSKAQGGQMDAEEARQQLEDSECRLQTLSDDAAGHNADALTSALDSLQTLKRDTDSPLRHGEGSSAGHGQSAGFEQPLIMFSAPNDIASTTARNTHLYSALQTTLASGENLTLASGKSLLASVAEGISLFAKNAGAKLFAAKGKVAIQAQSDDIELTAQNDVLITSTGQRIQLSAQDGILLTSGGAYIEIKDGNISIHAPGEVDVKGVIRKFSGPGGMKHMDATPQFALLPQTVPVILQASSMESTFALEQITELATRSTAAEFVLMLAPIFGFDIPAHTYIKLYDGLRAGSIANPEHRVMSAGAYPADYDNQERVIRVHEAALINASSHRDGATQFLAVLLHEFGHHLDNLLRTELADKNPDGTSTLAADAPEEEGAKFAYQIALLDFENSAYTRFATFTTARHPETALYVAYPEAQAAIKETQGLDAQRMETGSGQREGFGAGRGEHHDRSPHGSFGHESIEDALGEVGFAEATDRQAVYYGNWLRDYSQILDPKIIRAADMPKNLPAILSRSALTKMVDVLAARKFPELRKSSPDEYQVTPHNLGVYRPSEHIDNPKNFNPQPADPKTRDPEFEPWVLPDDPLLQIDFVSSMARYLHRSRDSMVMDIKRAVMCKRTPSGMRLFGAALHGLEDFFAHSNYVELSLIKLGYTSVLPWTSPAACKWKLPLVTGMFSSTDVIASLAEPLAMALFPVDPWTFVASEPGIRSDSEKMLLILLGEHHDERLLHALENYLALRDKWASTPGHQHIERMGWMAAVPMRLISNSYNTVFQSLLQLLGNSVDDAQTLLDEDPNRSGSTDPTHSQLAKDHDTHPFHTLAVKLAKEAVRVVGQAMNNKWRGGETEDPAQVIERFFTHPQDSTWQDPLVMEWAREHREEVKRGASLTELHHIHEQHGKAALARVKKMGEQGEEAWNYIQQHYEVLTGEKSQAR